MKLKWNIHDVLENAPSTLHGARFFYLLITRNDLNAVSLVVFLADSNLHCNKWKLSTIYKTQNTISAYFLQYIINMKKTVIIDQNYAYFFKCKLHNDMFLKYFFKNIKNIIFWSISSKIIRRNISFKYMKNILACNKLIQNGICEITLLVECLQWKKYTFIDFFIYNCKTWTQITHLI